jgi:hypothetical protein
MPRHLQIHWLCIKATAADSALLGECFHPSAVLGGLLWLTGPAWDEQSLHRARIALAACAQANAARGLASQFELKFECDSDDAPWSAGALCELASWFSSSENITKLEVLSHADQLLPILMPVLPACLTELRIDSPCTAACFNAVIDALRSREIPMHRGHRAVFLFFFFSRAVSLPSHECGAEARRLRVALAAKPRVRLSVTYRLAPETTPFQSISAHLAFVFAALPCSIRHISCPYGEVIDPAEAICQLFAKEKTKLEFDAHCVAAISAGALPILISALRAAAYRDGDFHFDVGHVAAAAETRSKGPGEDRL